MEEKKTIRLEGSRSHFSKNLILQIVKSVERGATRREIIDRYGVAKSTLSGWMQQYGSPAWQASQKPLSVPDRRSMARAIEEGRMTLNEAKLAYHLKSVQAVKGYLRQAEKKKPNSSCDYLTPSQAHYKNDVLKKRWKKYDRRKTMPEETETAGPGGGYY